VRHLKIALTRAPVEIRAWRRSTFTDKEEGNESPMMCPLLPAANAKRLRKRADGSRECAPATGAIALAQG
jgi:hypothetical protein